jgi:hypothetical protein
VRLRHSAPTSRREAKRDRGDRDRSDRDRDRDREREREHQRERDRNRDAWRQIPRQYPGTWTPWLLLQHAIEDLGARPVPASSAIHLSPAIRVEPGTTSGDAIAGQPNFVHALIFNLGSGTSEPTQVDFYWADPSLGLGPGNFTHI